jgi:hypothetical protein
MMTRHEFADWFAGQVQPRWPSWQVNGVVLNDWYVALGRYDAATLTKAVRRTFRSDSRFSHGSTRTVPCARSRGQRDCVPRPRPSRPATW